MDAEIVLNTDSNVLQARSLVLLMDLLHGQGNRASVLTPPFRPLSVVKSGAGVQGGRLLEFESAPRAVQGRRLFTGPSCVSLPFFGFAVLPLTQRLFPVRRS